ncbi:MULTISPECIES: carboxymuconolactone decarboxylase family protein [unclassified Dehalobacter]|jgi:Uncharacterized homolog of gamma-carboxymuconolactone decarboxylase subunit|uniref:carboxymuconolactone decarboxylase family protein n=1 Tax=unclassified Dehalobacter TaxID=2635733 RepID=UPI00028B6C56|nr:MULTISPECIES: carboxymuconolactone decarboxylase family protein [unclassified Dehalobacter]AFV01164.1 hypothetical protein DHBDCA_p136 [Dehalobacter sp. DCA]AFV04207.1 hypothetical protein DCF50_p201 [Dehalobacter sp. CF]
MALDVKIKELVAVGAAVAGNCIPCLQWHYNKCIELGIPIEDVKEAIEMARMVKEVPIKKIDELAEKLTGTLK